MLVRAAAIQAVGIRGTLLPHFARRAARLATAVDIRFVLIQSRVLAGLGFALPLGRIADFGPTIVVDQATLLHLAHQAQLDASCAPAIRVALLAVLDPIGARSRLALGGGALAARAVGVALAHGSVWALLLARAATVDIWLEPIDDVIGARCTGAFAANAALIDTIGVGNAGLSVQARGTAISATILIGFRAVLGSIRTQRIGAGSGCARVDATIAVHVAALSDLTSGRTIAAAVRVGLGPVLCAVTTGGDCTTPIRSAHSTLAIGHLPAGGPVRTALRAIATAIHIALGSILDAVGTAQICTAACNATTARAL